MRKGEKGIAILAPCLYRASGDPAPPRPDQRDAEPATARELRGFRVVHVFDLAQTEGDPLPDITPQLLAGAAPQALWDRLVALAGADGYAVERGDCGGANGLTRFSDRLVRIRADVAPAQAVKTLAHELGHIRADHHTRFTDRYHTSVDCRGLAEVEAESIAYIVTTAAGMDTAAYTVPYVTGWSDGNLDILRTSASRVLDAARAITTALGISDATPSATTPET